MTLPSILLAGMENGAYGFSMLTHTQATPHKCTCLYPHTLLCWLSKFILIIVSMHMMDLTHRDAHIGYFSILFNDRPIPNTVLQYLLNGYSFLNIFKITQI